MPLFKQTVLMLVTMLIMRYMLSLLVCQVINWSNNKRYIK